MKLIKYDLTDELLNDLKQGKLKLRQDPTFTNDKENIVLNIENERTKKVLRVQVQSFDVTVDGEEDISLTGAIVKDLVIERYFTTYGKTYFVSKFIVLEKDNSTVRIHSKEGDVL